MTKIKIYTKENEPKLSDKLIGTKDANGNTKNFSLEAILGLFNRLNGVNGIQFKFSNGGHPSIDYSTAGYFFTDTNSTEVGSFTQLIFNKETINPIDISPLFDKLGESENVIIKLENPEDPNNFFNFKVISITDNTENFVFGVEDFNELYLGDFINNQIYSLYFTVNSDLPEDFSKVVYFNSTNPATATIFDLNNPPVTNDDLLRIDDDNLYVGTDASTWVYKTSINAYETKIITSSSSNFYLSGTTIDSGGNKTVPIERTGAVGVGPATDPNHAMRKDQVESANASILATANSYTDSKVSSVYIPKGNKNDYADLVATGEHVIGYVYNLLDTGKNYVWVGTWDDIGGTFDISDKEDKTNKQNSLVPDGTGVKYVTVDAIILGLANKLDKGTYTGNAGDLKTEIDNIHQPDIVLRTTPPTRSVNTFTFPALGYDVLLSKVFKTNSVQFVTTIPAATTDYKRTDLIYFKPDNTIAKIQGTESITVAQRPDVPAGSIGLYFINVFGAVVDTPVPIDNLISIQDVYGTPWFNVKDYVRFEGVSFNSTQKLISINPLAPFTAYIDRNIGDDATGEIGNYNRKFKTIDGAFTRFGFSLTDNQAKNLIIQILTSGDYPINGQIPLTNIEFRSNNSVNIVTSANTFAPTNSVNNFSFFGKYSDNGDPVKNIYFNIPNGGYTHNNLVDDIAWSQAQTNILFNLNTIYVNSKIVNFFLGNTISYQKNLTKASINRSVALSSIIGQIEILGNVNLSLSSNITVNWVSGTGSFRYGAASGQNVIFSVGNITVTGQTLCGNGGGTTITEFRQSSITNDFLLGVNSVGGTNIFRGTVLAVNNMFTSFINSSTLNIVFESFVGNLGAGASGHSIRLSSNGINSLKIVNSTISLNGMLMNPINVVKTNIDNSTITQLTPTVLLDFGNANTPLVISGLNTNATGLTNTSLVPVTFNSISFKEKRSEQIIRSKSDIINRTLDSTVTYVIDGILTLVTGEFIRVPAGGLTINGYGFSPSSIKKNVSGESIFISPAGNSGDFVSINISYYPGLGSVFNLIDSDGTHAIELDKVNFQGVTGSSLGILSGYRQLTGTTCGFYGLSDGFTLDGNWSGWKLTNSNIIGFGGTGTLFKAGASLLFSNRFYIDLNIQVATGSKLCDFAPANLTNDKSLQVVNCYTKVNGVINAGLTNVLFPNITETSSKAYFVNNIGIKNSFTEPYGLKTTNMVSYANDAAASAGGVQIGEVYVESSSGYFKTRLV